MSEKEVRYSTGFNEYAYDKYRYDFTPINFASVNKTTVTQPIKFQRRKVYTIGLKHSPRPQEKITVGDLKLQYIVLAVFGADRKTGDMLYRIRRTDYGDMSEGVDGTNAKKGARVYFNNRLTRQDFTNILKDM